MKLKGHAKLTLRDAKTGRVIHIEEHDNAITPALTRIFAGDIAGTLNYNELMPILNKLIGGVCIFNGTVDPTDVFLPRAEDATLTAHAGRNSYSDPSDDRKRGTPGASSSIPNGYRWAWTWANTQGNGSITDVCITHADTGDFWNEDTPNTMSDDFCPVAAISNEVLDTTDYGWTEQGVLFPHIVGEEEIPVSFIGDVDHAVTIEGCENNIKVHAGKFTGSGAWLWNALGETYDDQAIVFSAAPWQQGTFANFGIGCFYIAVDKDNQKVYAIACGQTVGDTYIPYDNTLDVNILDLATSEATQTTISVSSVVSSYGNYARTDGAAMPAGVQFYAQGVNEERCFKQLQIVDGNIFIPIVWVGSGLNGTTDCSVRVNLVNTSDKEVVKGFYNNDSSGNYCTNQTQIDLGNGRIMNSATMAWTDSNGDYKGQEIDVDTTLFPSNFRLARAYACSQPTDSPVQYFTHCYNNTSGVRGCILNKLYQATAFHIENGPVTKTASMTMTLEYDITQEEES